MNFTINNDNSLSDSDFTIIDNLLNIAQQKPDLITQNISKLIYNLASKIILTFSF
jgi:hypothetical protein